MLLSAILTTPFMAILKNLGPAPNWQEQQSGRLLMQAGQSRQRTRLLAAQEDTE